MNQTVILIWMDAHIIPVDSPPRRWPRNRLDIPLRVVIHTPDKTAIRDGRGRELSEGGMCLAAGVELKRGELVEIEFTPAYSGHPIRVRAVTRNVNGYNYGVEFAASSDQERHEIASLFENLQTLSSSYSPSYSSPSGQKTQAQKLRHSAPAQVPTEYATALFNVSSGPTPECAPLPAGSGNAVGKSRRTGKRARPRSTEKFLGN